MKKLMLVLLLVMSLSGCEKRRPETAGEYVYRRSFAMRFYEAERLELRLNPYVNEESPDAVENKTQLFFYIKGNYNEICGYLRGYEIAGIEKPELYDELCQKYGDMTYNREEFVVYGSVPSFLAYSPVSIEIVSDSDFDEAHPAGTSLADLVTYDGISSKPFVDSGYQMYEWENDDKFYYAGNIGQHRDDKTDLRPYYPIYKKVSELVAEDLMLIYGGIGCIGYFHFPVPTLSQLHHITVTFTDERGETFSDTIEMNFE